MKFSEAMMHDSIWFERPQYEEAREHYQLFLTNNITHQISKPHEEEGLFTKATSAVAQVASSAASGLINDIAKARDTIKQSLSNVAHQVQHVVTAESDSNIAKLATENTDLRKLIADLAKQVANLDVRVSKLEGKTGQTKKPENDDDDDFDLFGDDDEEEEETEEEKNKKAEAVAKYNAKKAKKPALIAKSSLLLDVKPWDDETDMAEIERLVRGIKMDGLVWGASKLIPVGYGIKKLQILCVVEDDKVGTDFLEEEITKFEDLVQSMDVAAFNKI